MTEASQKCIQIILHPKIKIEIRPMFCIAIGEWEILHSSHEDLGGIWWTVMKLISQYKKEKKKKRNMDIKQASFLYNIIILPFSLDFWGEIDMFSTGIVKFMNIYNECKLLPLSSSLIRIFKNHTFLNRTFFNWKSDCLLLSSYYQNTV